MSAPRSGQRPISWVHALCIAFGVCPAAWAGESSSLAASPADGTWDTRFSISEEYRLRSASASSIPAGDPAMERSPAEEDHDLRLGIQGESADPTGRYRLIADLGAWWDIDGTASGDQVQGMRGITDTRDLWWDVFTLEGVYQGEGRLRELRVGRQNAEHGLPMVFDGLATRVNALPARLDLFAFGGRTVHFFSIADRPWESWLGSVGTSLRISETLRMELDYRFLREDVALFGNADHQAVVDHTYGLTGWWRPTEWLSARAEARGVDDQISLLSSSAKLTLAAWQAGASVLVSVQPMTLTEMNQQDNPLFTVLGQSLPHLRLAIDAFWEQPTRLALFGLHLGWSARLLLEGSEGPFNRNLARAWGLLEALDLYFPGLSAGLTVDDFYTPTDGALAENNTLSLGGFVRYERARFRTEVASAYQRYRYVYYRDVDELSDVRTVSAEVAVKLFSWLALRLRYELERFDRDVHTLTVALTEGR